MDYDLREYFFFIKFSLVVVVIIIYDRKLLYFWVDIFCFWREGGVF